MTPSGIKPATFRLVAQCLYQPLPHAPGVQLLSKIICCDQLMGPSALHNLVMWQLCPVVLSTQRFFIKEQPKKGKE